MCCGTRSLYWSGVIRLSFMKELESFGRVHSGRMGMAGGRSVSDMGSIGEEWGGTGAA